MLDTLVRIGKWQAEGKSKWFRFINFPSTSHKKQNEENQYYYIINLVFDLDAQSVYLDESNISEYDPERSAEELLSLKIKTGNSKAFYPTITTDKLSQLYKAFFGKEGDEKVKKGHLQEIIEKDFPSFKNKKIYQILGEVFALKKDILALMTKEKNGNSTVNVKYLLDGLSLKKNENIALVCVCIKDEKSGIPAITPIAQLVEYKDLIEEMFFPKRSESLSNALQQSLCYATGKNESNVEVLGLDNRYSLNKMFVTTTINYASSFEKNSNKNYQAGADTQVFLDIGSTYLLANLKVQIAGVQHVILPEFLNTSEVDIDMAIDRIKISGEFLFNSGSLKEVRDFAETIGDETDDIFWLNFLSFDSDGKNFKSTGQIKYVSHHHFNKILKTFSEVHWEMRGLEAAVNWQAFTTKKNQEYVFSFHTIYGLIPVKKDLKNKALALMKAILEKKPIEPGILFEYFCELMLCHCYVRYKSYTNIDDYSISKSRTRDDYFIWACRDSVFKYLAFFKVLKQLQLINMETRNDKPVHLAIQEDIDNFFESMEYSNAQKAMFYLGRMLKAVTDIQRDKKKTVLEKINFNGMDKDHILRLNAALLEKAAQYRNEEAVIFHNARFTAHFDFKGWDMSPQEAVFFIMSGYTYGLVKKEKPSVS